jgi:hypothetical protein
MAFDTAKWLSEMGFGEAEVKELAPKFETRAEQLEKNQLRQADYSRAQNALKGEQEKLTAANERVNAEMAEWARLQAEGGEVTAKMRESLEKAEQKALTLTQRVQRIAIDAGLDPAKALEGIDQQPPPKKEEAPPVDLSKYVPADQFAQLSNYLFNMAAQMPMLAAEHHALTGETLDTAALAAEIQARAGKKGAQLDPRAVWEEKHEIPAKRQAKEQAARAEEIRLAELKGFERARTEQALPVPPSNGVRSPMLRSQDGGPRKSVLERPQPESGVRSAAAKLAQIVAQRETANAGTGR